MNGTLRFQSSTSCDNPARLTVAPVRQLMLQLTGPTKNNQDCPMMTDTMDRKKLMLLMALCLTFATAIPMIVLAAG